MQLSEQLKTLSGYPASFISAIDRNCAEEDCLSPRSLRVMQINVGRRCNMSCGHCHVQASPARAESMDRNTAEKCMAVLSSVPEIEVVDLTGGAPEMNGQFTYLVEESRRLGKRVIDRCNLTILEEPGYDHLIEFMAGHDVEIAASLPHYSESLTDRWRGKGVFAKSIRMLKKLNERGYGSALALNLVYNPPGLMLSARQAQLEREFRDELLRRYGIIFNNLMCINNMPINRFLQSLLCAGKFEKYMALLVDAFNPTTLGGLMCRHQVSVGYDGRLYDCDFNQMLDIQARPIGSLDEFDYAGFMERRVQIANHCFGCTAGGGSSCGGELDKGA